MRKRVSVFIFGFLVLIILMSVSVSSASTSFGKKACLSFPTHTDLIPKEIAIKPNTEVCVNPPLWGVEKIGVNSNQGSVNSNGPSLDCSEWAGWTEKSGKCCKTISASSIYFNSFGYSCMQGSVTGGTVYYTPAEPVCTSHDYFSCYVGDIYWYDSCGVKEEKKEECGISQYIGSNYCYDDDVYRDYISRGCSGSSCTESASKSKQSECGISGCVDNACVQEELECMDTDTTPEFPDGKNYNLKGSISIEGIDKVEDYCYNNNLALLEWWCDSECSAGYCGTGYACPNGCENGACVVLCTPDCTCANETCVGEICDDGCEGTCYGTLLPDCSGLECGTAPNGCGEANACGTCEEDETCVEGICEKIETYYWASSKIGPPISQTSVLVGTTEVSMILNNSGLAEGTEVEFEIREDDIFFDDDIRTGDDAITGIADSFGNVEATWLITQEDLDETNDYGEFYFNVQLGESDFLELTDFLAPGYCVSVDYCMNYETEIECVNDFCDVADESIHLIDPSVTCGDGFDCKCSWVNNECGIGFLSIKFSCGNGIIDIGEQCDGDNFGGIEKCENFGDFDGGDLACDESACLFDTSACTGGGGEGSCGNGVINIGEQCDGDDWGNYYNKYDCKLFGDFNMGDLACDSITCLFDTSNCEKEIDPVLGSGFCWLDQKSDDDCEDGIYEYSWEWVWNWETEIYDEDYWEENIEICNGKDVGSKTIPCPTQMELDFFGFYGFILSSMIIALIYIILIFKKEYK